MKPAVHPAGPKQPRTVDGWFAADDAPLPPEPLERLVYYARLAPSSHNTQPWKFVVGAAEIDVFADLSYWLKAADPSRRELHASLGCAIEAIRIAADYAQFGTTVQYFPLHDDETLVARIAVSLGGPKRAMPAASLLEQVVTRRTSRKPFERGRVVPDEARKALYRSFEVGDVSLHFLHERPQMLALAELEEAADRRLFADAAYRDELSRWVGEGMLGTGWLASKLCQFAVGNLPVAERVAKDDAARLASSPLVALLSTRDDQATDAVQSGEAFMRLALMAEAMGIRVQPVSQVLEVPETRAEVAKLFSLGGRVPQHLFRMGYAEAETGPRRRRPLASMMLRAGAGAG